LRYNGGVAVREALREVDYRALAEFRHRLRRFLAFSEEQARRAGLTPQQHQVLLAVRAAAAPMSIKALAERLVLRHHTTVGLVDRLVRKRLVRRERLPADRRVASIALTARGATVLRRLSIAHSAELRRAGPDLVDALVTATRAWRSGATDPTPGGLR
jgi:DNA-binding MarR family transcriptional regulator